MEDAFKSQYQKYKCRVKLWEKGFQKKYNRIPSKHDIHEAPKEIRYSYKMYYKLKTSMLENTLSDVLSEDGFDILDYSQSDTGIESEKTLPEGLSELTTSLNESFSNINDIKNSSNLDGRNALTNIVNVNEDHVIKEFEPVENLESNNSAWLGLTEKNNVQKKVDSPPKKQFKSNLSAKLFKSSSFSKRNPRKSLSRLSSGNLSTTSGSFNSNNSLRESLPDLETILAQKAMEQNSSSTINKNPLMTSKGISTDIDKCWLDRCSNELGITNKYEKETLPEESHKKFGLSNLIIPKSFQSLQTNTVMPANEINQSSVDNYKDDSDEVVGNSEDENTETVYQHMIKRRRILKDIDKNQQILQKHALLDKPKIDNLSNVETKTNLDEIAESSVEVRKSSRKKINKDDNATIVKKRAKKVGSKKKLSANKDGKRSKKMLRKNDEKIPDTMPTEEEIKPEDMKYEIALEFGNLTSTPSFNVDELKKAEIIVDKYANSMSVANTSKNTSKFFVADEKIERAKARLQEKIDQKRLNENFVRIDVNKKIFVRGKKAFNFSKYKKKMWKHQKKVNALCGPDMDMGGCDGGVLKCFTCGQVGHFAQQCKVKGDSLAPYDPDEIDESPFPTLEEAHQMASSKAAVVHSSNMEKLPKASNPVIHESNEEIMESEESENGDNFDKAFDEKFEFEELLEENEDKNIKEESKPTFIGHKIPEDFLKLSGLLEKNDSNTTFETYYKLKSDGNVMEVTDEVINTLKMFGHTNFRKGQDRAIMRILSGQSTLVTLSTGSGKSLCYQLPAYLYARNRKCITLVISPLVSLMEDQVYGVPDFLRAHCLHTNQTPQQRVKIMQIIDSGDIDVLLISPEAVVAGEKSTGFGSLLRKLPPIAFACIDEAHCVSQWSHNFRPSYLMICKVLQKNLGVKTILGLTATATLPTRQSIIRHLYIKDGMNGVISDIPLPDNLILSVSKDKNREQALIELLRSPRFDSCQSIIIYCTRRDECERIATFIRTCFQNRKPENSNTGKKRKRVNWNAEPYHAGMPASRRRTIQSAFMKNELRIVVATIAFGMGINKSDIRSVIHYNMPSNFESYVQEVGRAGRDGKLAHCHLFLDANGSDQNELRRHIYANSIDRHVIRKLLQKVFVSCSCRKNLKNRNCQNDVATKIPQCSEKMLEENIIEKYEMMSRVCPGHEIGFSIEETVEELDIPEQNISTLLCYLELDGRYMINVLSSAYTMCKVISYGGPNQLKKSAKECPPLAMGIALQLKKEKFKNDSNIIEFSVIEVASAIGWNSGVVKYQLKNLEWNSNGGKPKRSSISIQFFNLGFRIRAPGDFTADESDNALDLLHNRSVKQEKTQLIQLQYVFEGMSSLAYQTCAPCCSSDFNAENSDKLKTIIRDYFQNDYPKNITLTEQIDNVPDDNILNDCKAMINMYPDNNFTGRSLARIFHGIQSPNYPAVIWGRSKFWRMHTNVDFNRIVQLGNNLIVRMRT